MRVAIIGAGPAGIFTALFAKQFNGEIILFEASDRIGAKLRLTGGGRMNLANRNFGVEQFVSREPNLLRKLFRVPWFQRIETLFSELGFSLAWENERAFPKSFSAEREVERLAQELNAQKNLRVRLRTEVSRIEKRGEKFVLQFHENGAEQTETFDVVVLASGGMLRLHAPRKSVAEIYALPTQLNHTLIPPSPALAPLRVQNFALAALAGLAFPARLTESKTRKFVTNDLLLTHTGFSGPAALDFSALLVGDEMEVNFLPHLSEAEFTRTFQKLREGSNSLRNFLRELLPKRFADWQIELIGIPPAQKIAELGKTEFQKLIQNIFHARFENAQKGDFSEAWTTRGGVSLREVNVATLESKLHPHLFFAGELLDATGFCGGYNLTFAAVSARMVSEEILDF